MVVELLAISTERAVLEDNLHALSTVVDPIGDDGTLWLQEGLDVNVRWLAQYNEVKSTNLRL